jgi:DNA-binding transcriptional MerR regulator
MASKKRPARQGKGTRGRPASRATQSRATVSADAKSRGWVRMGALARQTGLPASTIKHYISEGLLPAEHMLVRKNSALYAPQCAQRIRQIKELQTVHFLPLSRIRQVLSEGVDATRATVEAAVDRVRALGPRRTSSRRKLLERGLTQADLSTLKRLGLIEDGATIDGEDLLLVETVLDARAAGLMEHVDLSAVLQRYQQAVRILVQMELDIFTSAIMPGSGSELARITEEAMQISERLVVLLRRRQLLPTLAQVMSEK